MAPPRTARESFWIKELPFTLVLILTIAGVAYTSFSKKPIVGYWEILAPIIALVCVAAGWEEAGDKSGRLRGTGFDQEALKSLYGTMQPLRTHKKPFDQKVKDEKATTWLIPKLVGEVKFTEWTSEGEMRHPAFLGLRSDKKAIDVIREQP
jgi:hypothetical protein